MSEHILFLTGKLAERTLRRTLADLDPSDFSYDVRVLGISVAALMTADLIERRLEPVGKATRVMVPGRCRGDLNRLAERFGVPFLRGPDELKDLPDYFGKPAGSRDLSRHDVLIFAEIVDAPHMAIAAIVERARCFANDGADVIDLGCLPDTEFPHLEAAVRTLVSEGFRVSVDSLQTEELLRGARAGAAYLLSLTEDTLWVADEVEAVPILISPQPNELDKLFRTIEAMQAKKRPFLADAILDPIHMGFTDSILRYHALRRAFPDIDIMLGAGNITELTHADTTGATALLMGIVSELRIAAVLTTEVSGHCRKVVKETDVARRIMYAAREDHSPPRHISEDLLALHERKPFPYTVGEIQELAGRIKDHSYRILVSEAGIHVFNRDRRLLGTDPYDLFPELAVDDDPAHAFYLGMELARAQIAWQLGKRYNQDEELGWACAVAAAPEDLSRFAPERATRKASKRAGRRRRRGARK